MLGTPNSITKSFKVDCRATQTKLVTPKLLPNVAREPDLVRGITKHAILQKEKWTIV